MLVTRDPFARSEVHRESVAPYGKTCAFCGSVRQTKNGRAYLYQYRQESDSGRASDIPGLFCSIGCMRAYHNAEV